VTGRDKQRHVVNLRTRLIETFAQVLQFEGTKSTVVVAVMRKTCPAFISPDHPVLIGLKIPFFEQITSNEIRGCA
jgi:hypothetical protein